MSSEVCQLGIHFIVRKCGGITAPDGGSNAASNGHVVEEEVGRAGGKGRNNRDWAG